MKDVSLNFQAPNTMNEGSFVTTCKEAAAVGELTFPHVYDIVGYDKEVHFHPPDRVPTYATRTDLRMPLTVTSYFKRDYSGNIQGSMTLDVDVSEVIPFIGGHTIILYGFYTMDPDKGLTIPADSELTIDLAEVLQWSKLVFGRYIGRQAGMALTYVFKFVGHALPNVGKLKFGYKVIGATSPEQQMVQGRVGLHVNMSMPSTYNRLQGDPVIRGPSNPESDHELSTFVIVPCGGR